MRRSSLLIISLVPALILLASCASIVSKSSYPVTVNSQPDQANITIVDETGKKIYSGTTPTTVTLETKAGFWKGKDYTVTFSKEGYADYTAEIRRGVDGWYVAGNLLFGGLIGWLIVDPITGAMWTLNKDLSATLAPNTTSQLKNEGLQVVYVGDVPESLRPMMDSVTSR